MQKFVLENSLIIFQTRWSTSRAGNFLTKVMSRTLSHPPDCVCFVMVFFYSMTNPVPI